MKSPLSHDAIHSSSVEATSSNDTVTHRRSSKGAVETFSHDVELPEYGRDGSLDSVSLVKDTVHRRLKSRHIQLIGIGGTIGTALYVSIGNGLLNGGPGSLFLAFTIW